MKKLDIAKLLATTPNVMASKGDIVQFFHSNQFHPEEEIEGNHINDYLEFSKQLDADLLYLSDWSLDKTHLSGSVTIANVIPKKVQKQLELEAKELEDYINNFQEDWISKE